MWAPRCENLPPLKVYVGANVNKACEILDVTSITFLMYFTYKIQDTFKCTVIDIQLISVFIKQVEK